MGKVNTWKNLIPNLRKEEDLGWEKSRILFSGNAGVGFSWNSFIIRIWDSKGVEVLGNSSTFGILKFPRSSGILEPSGSGIFKVPGFLGILVPSGFGILSLKIPCICHIPASGSEFPGHFPSS